MAKKAKASKPTKEVYQRGRLIEGALCKLIKSKLPQHRGLDGDFDYEAVANKLGMTRSAFYRILYIDRLPGRHAKRLIEICKGKLKADEIIDFLS